MCRQILQPSEAPRDPRGTPHMSPCANAHAATRSAPGPSPAQPAWGQAQRHPAAAQGCPAQEGAGQTDSRTAGRWGCRGPVAGPGEETPAQGSGRGGCGVPPATPASRVCAKMHGTAGGCNRGTVTYSSPRRRCQAGRGGVVTASVAAAARPMPVRPPPQHVCPSGSSAARPSPPELPTLALSPSSRCLLCAPLSQARPSVLAFLLHLRPPPAPLLRHHPGLSPARLASRLRPWGRPRPPRRPCTSFWASVPRVGAPLGHHTWVPHTLRPRPPSSHSGAQFRSGCPGHQSSWGVPRSPKPLCRAPQPQRGWNPDSGPTGASRARCSPGPWAPSRDAGEVTCHLGRPRREEERG